MARMMASEASRRRWYWTSVRVCWGATVMESPVWTPMGSMFSMEQTMTTLSLRSRMTSSSNSFQPMTLSSSSTWWVGEASRPAWTTASNSWSVAATPPPCPPRVKLGRMMRGRWRPSCERGAGLGHGVDHGALGHAQADGGHGGAELVAGLGPADGGVVGADELDAVLLEGAVLGEGDGQVERGLAAQGGQQGVRPLHLDDLGHHFGHQGLDVGAVGERGVGHDGGRVGVDQHHLEALLHEHLAGLGAGVVELAGLPDDDGAGAEQHDLVDVGAAGHG